MLIDFYHVLRLQDCFPWRHGPGYLYSTPDLYHDFSFLVSFEFGSNNVKSVYEQSGKSPLVFGSSSMKRL